ALLTSARPDVHLLPAISVRTPDVQAALLRFQAELTAAQRLDAPAPPRLDQTLPVDALAAAAVLATERFAADGDRTFRIAGAESARGRPANGWEQLVAAIDREASGDSSGELLRATIDAAEARDRRALAWTALRFWAALCRRRGAEDAHTAALARLRALLERWALSLPAADASSALERPDRARLLEPPSALEDDAARMVEVALALAHERDAAKLTSIA